MISQSTIEEVRSKASLLDIVGDSVQLKRQGASYTGLCPFHSERSPSFHIRDNEQYFHCFGCGKSGNVFTYLMESRGLTFPEAIEELAQRYGIEIQRDGGKKPKEDQTNKADLFGINALAYHFFRSELLKKDTKVVAYVKERKLTKASIEAFGISFASLGNGLTGMFKKQGIAEDLMVQSGLIRRNQRGELYDALRGRLLFPIWIDNKKIAGFGGRAIPSLHEIDSDRVPKYLNSPETPIYQKSKILYGLPQAFPSIKEKNEVFVVEGYMDVVGLWQAGVCNVVASCGTALTEDHVKKLSRITKKVIVLFDSDSAGKAAAGKSFLTFLNTPVDVWALFVADGEDPDSISKSYGDKTYEYLSSLPRVPLIDCYIEMLLKKYGTDDIASLGSATLGTLTTEVVHAIQNAKDVITRDALLKRASQKLRVSFEKMIEVAEGVNKGSRGEGMILKDLGSATLDDQNIVAVTDLPKLDREILNIVIAKKEEFISRLLRESSLVQAIHSSTLRFVQALAEIFTGSSSPEEQKKELVKAVLKDFGPTWVVHWKQAHEMAKSKEISFSKQFEDCILQVKKSEFLKLLEGLKQDATRTIDMEEKALLLQQVVELEKRQRGLV